MMPTLMIGDYLVVSNFSYGISRHSIPFSPSWLHGRIFARLPARGDVVVFVNANANNADYVKRVVGLPGDHIQLRGGMLYVNGQAVVRHATGGIAPSADDGDPLREKLYSETLPNGVTYSIAKIGDDGAQNDTPDYLVPDDRLFVLGDNRDNSVDSRYGPNSPDNRLRMAQGVGFLPLDDLVGRAALVVFSYDAASSHPASVRWDRLFAAIR